MGPPSRCAGNRAVQLVTFVLTVSILTACVWAQGPRTRVDPLLAELPASEAQVVLQVQALMSDPRSDRAAVNRALEHFVWTCMTAKGQKFIPDSFHGVRIDLGGGVVHHGDISPAGTPEPTTAPRPSDEWLEAYSNPSTQIRFRLPDGSEAGLATGGCVGDALRAMYGPQLEEFARARMVGENFLPNVVRETLQSSAVSKTISKWSQCSRAAGLDVPFPWSVTTTAVRLGEENQACIRHSGLQQAYMTAFRQSVHHRCLIDGPTISTWFGLMRRGESAVDR
jgi:hypothetical protein